MANPCSAMAPPPLTVILEHQAHTQGHSIQAASELEACLRLLWPQIACVLVLPRAAVNSAIPRPDWVPEGVHWRCLGPSEPMNGAIAPISTPLVGYIPDGALPASHLPRLAGQPGLVPWLLEPSLPLETARAESIAGLPWIAHTELLQSIGQLISSSEDWMFLNLVRRLEAQQLRFFWGTATARSEPWRSVGPTASPGGMASSVLALIPHYGCERWLSRCLRSLRQQTHPLDGIVVIDDGSGNPPTSIVQEFPSVTLLASTHRVGPYRLIQQVIQDTHYGAYLFQDADDWSSGDRLQRLLQAAAQTGAELIGTQEFRITEATSAVIPVGYPLDVNQALSEKPGHGLLHPSSLVTRDLVMRLGGFATGLRFGADSEFLLRAVLAARVVNIADYAYFRRKRSGSLTTHPDTGLESPARQALIQQCKARARWNQAALLAGKSPDLTPLTCADAIQLHHVTGPGLGM